MKKQHTSRWGWAQKPSNTEQESSTVGWAYNPIVTTGTGKDHGTSNLDHPLLHNHIAVVARPIIWMPLGGQDQYFLMWAYRFPVVYKDGDLMVEDSVKHK